MTRFVSVTGAAAWAAIAATLGGCAAVSQPDADRAKASHFVADRLPTWAGGEPAHLPPRPANPPAYPRVFDAPPARQASPLNAEEQKKLTEDLGTTRDRAAARARGATSSEPERRAAPGRQAGEPQATTNSN